MASSRRDADSWEWNDVTCKEQPPERTNALSPTIDFGPGLTRRLPLPPNARAGRTARPDVLYTQYRPSPSKVVFFGNSQEKMVVVEREKA